MDPQSEKDSLEYTLGFSKGEDKKKGRRKILSNSNVLIPLNPRK